MKDVIYKVDLNDRNKLLEFKKTIVREFKKGPGAEVLIALTHLRMNNTESNIRYILGHVK